MGAPRHQWEMIFWRNQWPWLVKVCCRAVSWGWAQFCVQPGQILPAIPDPHTDTHFTLSSRDMSSLQISNKEEMSSLGADKEVGRDTAAVNVLWITAGGRGTVLGIRSHGLCSRQWRFCWSFPGLVPAALGRSFTLHVLTEAQFLFVNKITIIINTPRYCIYITMYQSLYNHHHYPHSRVSHV